MTGATSMDAARVEWNAGNYGSSALYGAQAFVEAGLTVAGLGAGAASAAVRGMTAWEAATARGAYGAAAADAAAIRANVLNNIADSQTARASSNFGTFISNEGRIQEVAHVWPPNRGRFGPIQTIELQPGALVDRYGSTRGKFVAPEGTPFVNRALPSYYENSVPYFRYEVARPIPGTLQSRVLPWFGQSGMGTQFELAKPVQWYLDNCYLKVK